MARRGRAPGRLARVKGAPRFPHRAEKNLELAMRAMARGFAAYVRRAILPRVADFARRPAERADAKPGNTAERNPAAKAEGRKMAAAAEQAFSSRKLAAAADKSATQIKNNSQDEFKRLRVDVRKEPALRVLVSGWTRDIAERAAGMAKDQAKILEEILATGNGRHADTIAREIEERLGVVESRAAFIARDAVGTLNSLITRERFRGAGVEEYVWVSMDDERVRDRHVELDGETFEVDGPGDSEEGHPGEPPNCFPEWTTLARENTVLRAYRHFYRGELTSLITNAGEPLECTPNHPVLTSAGWKPAKNVDVGDYIFDAGSKRGLFAEENAKHRNPTLAQVFDALSLVGSTKLIRGTASQFHGDALVGEDVHVVSVDRSLKHGFDSSSDERFHKALLAEPDMEAKFVPRARALSLGLLGLGLPASGMVRSLSYRLALHESRRHEARDVRFGTIADVDPVAIQEVGDGLSLDAVSRRDAFDGGALDVESERLFLREAFRVLHRAHSSERVDAPSKERLGELVNETPLGDGHFTYKHPLLQHLRRVVEKRRCEYEGYVYNLETDVGWYAVGDGHGPIVSNCRCVQFPIKPEKGDDEPQAEEPEEE